MFGELYSYETTLRNGSKRQGFYLSANNRIVEVAPLPGYSQESFEVCKDDLLSLFESQVATRQYCRSVSFALACLSYEQTTIQGIEHCALLRSSEELENKPGYKRYKLKLKNLTLFDAIQFTAEVYKKVNSPLRVDCNQTWSFEQTISYLSYFSPDVIEYIEEPTPSLFTNIEIGRRTLHTVALDELLLTTELSSLKEIASEVAFILKPTILGPLEPYLSLRAKKNILSAAFETGIGMRWLLNCLHLSPYIDRLVGSDTYSDLHFDPAEPPFSGELSWNVQLKSGLDLLQSGELFLGKEEPLLMKS